MFTLHTNSFPNGGEIPRKYTCEGEDVSPQLSWSDPPARAQSLALIVEDPDAPSGTFTHWVLYGLPSDTRELAEGASKGQLPGGARQGRNDFGKLGYSGPCPPPGKPHRYFFKLYALDNKLDLQPGASRQQFEQATRGHVVAQAEIMGKFRR
jgi:Raf kinase inhibitor-like YbhB/YbcL family protein